MALKNYQEAIKEAYATTGTEYIFIDSFEFINGDTRYRVVNNTEDLTLTLEDGRKHLFERGAVQVKLPASDTSGPQNLQIALDNADKRIMSFITQANANQLKTTIKYRPYLNTDLTQPQINPALELVLTEVQIANGSIQAQASISDLLNTPFLSETYTRDKFPTLGN